MNESWMVGPCWFFCGHRHTLVLWIGTITTELPTHQAPLYACGSCLEALRAAVEDYTHAAGHLPVDEHGREVPLYAPTDWNWTGSLRTRPGAGERRPRTRLGCAWSRLIRGETRQREALPCPGDAAGRDGSEVCGR